MASREDAEDHALQCLLEAFPNAPLELIASAFTEANSDPDIAAGLISFSLKGISCNQPSTSAHGDRSSNANKDSSAVKPVCGRRPVLRARGPSPPTLEDFFPSSPEKNAWIEPLTGRLQKSLSLQGQQSISPEPEVQHEYNPQEFPSLEVQRTNENNTNVRASTLTPPFRSPMRSSRCASAAFGLASSARSGNCKESSTRTLAGRQDSLTNLLKQTKANHKLLWDSETEAALLSMLGDKFNLDIDAVRDVLGHYEGDIEKSFGALSQLSFPASANSYSPSSASEFQADEKKDIRTTQGAVVHEALSDSEEQRDLPPQLAKAILESLFSKPQEVNIEIQENHKQKVVKKRGKEVVKPPEIPDWKAMTSTELDASGVTEGFVQSKELNVKCVDMVKRSEMDALEKEQLIIQMGSYGDWDSYERHNTSAKEHWKAMQTYLKAATAAYADSNVPKAELLTAKANEYKQLSMEAKERANTFLLEMKSQQNESDFTLDLQQQHVSEALQLLRIHLKSFSAIPSCRMFTVITGCSDDTKSGHIKIKHEVVGYLSRKGYTWDEISPFCLQVHLKKACAALVDER